MKIIPPEGYEVDKENSTFECIKFKPIKEALPTTWEEFCKVYPIQEGEAYINHVSMVVTLDFSRNRSFNNKNILPSEEMAEAVLALCQLIQLRDCYNQGWKPDWCNNRFDKWCIEIQGTRILRAVHANITHVLAFETDALRNEFLKNFKDLIEIAKPLL